MIHPHTEVKFINEDVGFGVVATRRIPRGSITWVMDKLDRIFSPDDLIWLDSKYAAILDKYSFRNNTGDYVLCWDHARFVNHSFRPNCITTAYDFELAIRDIKPEEELTNDYSTLNLEAPFYCLPEKNIKRQVVMPGDFLRYYTKWDRQLKSAFQSFNTVLQPLAQYLDPAILSKARAIARGQIEMDSIISCLYSRPLFEDPAETAKTDMECGPEIKGVF